MRTCRTNLRCCGHQGILWKRVQMGVKEIELQYFLGGGERHDDIERIKCPACGKVGRVAAESYDIIRLRGARSRC